MAVLPTPGSPISTGLFLVRRESTCTTRQFFIASDHRIKLAFAGLLREVASVALECLILGFGILVSHLLRAAYRGQGFQNRIVSRTVPRQDFLGGIAFHLRDGQQQVLGGNVSSLKLSASKHAPEPG